MKVRFAGIMMSVALLGVTVAPVMSASAQEPKNPFYQVKKADLVIEGEVKAIDAAAGTVTIQHKKKAPMTITIAQGSMLFVKHKKELAALSDFKVGEHVKVAYQQNGPALVAGAMWQPGANPGDKEKRAEKQAE